MRQLQTFPPTIRSYLRGFAARRRRLLVVRAVGWAAFALAAWVLLGCGVDRVLHLGPYVRLALLFVGASGVFAVLLRLLVPAHGPIDWVQVAQAIESANPHFSQRLVTVTSQLLDEPAHRGSEQIVSHLAKQLEQEIGGTRRHYGIAARSALRPWAYCAIATIVLAVLTRVPALGMQQLLVRCVNPIAPVPPVTTTQLQVTPGDCDLAVAQPLRIEVRAERFGGETVWVHLNDDNEHWSRAAMEPLGEGRFAFALANIERDTRYYITAGDASSRMFDVRIKRPPAVVEYRVQYKFPSYTGRPPFTVRNTDGIIEAPIGSEALVTIVASEPLQSATLSHDGTKLETAPGFQDTARQVSLPINKDAVYQVQLLSTRGVAGKGRQTIQVHAAADHPPIVRLTQADQTFRVGPRDNLPLNYQVLDDFGIASVSIVAQVNGNRTLRIPLTLGGDARRQEQAININLESWRLGSGDVVSLSIAARDNDGQTTTSDALRLYISANAIDLESQARLRELSDALQLAQMLASQWDGALRAARSAAPQTQPASNTSRLARYLSSASELSALLRQSLLRVNLHSNSPQLCDLLAMWMDWAQQQLDTADDLARQSNSDESSASAEGRIKQAHDLSHQLHDQLRTITRAERAAAVLADLKDIRQAPASMPADPIAADRRTQMLKAAQEDLRLGARDAGVDPDLPDMQARLREKVDLGTALLHDARPIDWAAVAQQWGNAIRDNPTQATDFDARLAAAFQAEAVRPDSAATHAQDLELAAWAAAGFEAAANRSATKPTDSALPTALVDVMSALQKEWALRGVSSQPADAAIHIAAQKARQQLAAWAGEPDRIAAMRPGLTRLHDARAEALAVRAGVETAARNYQKAAELDDALARLLIDAAKPVFGANQGPTTRPDALMEPPVASRIEARVDKIQRAHQAISRTMSTVQATDQLQQNQQRLADQLSAATMPSADLAEQQKQLSQSIDNAARQQDQAMSSSNGSSDDDPQWRGQAADALILAQQGLSSMPQALAAVQSAAAAKREADARAKTANAEAQAAQGIDQKEMAQRAAEQAAQDANDAADRLHRALAPVQAQSAEQLSQILAPYAPDTSGAKDAVAQSLAPALAALESSANAGDVSAVDQHAAEARQAIDAVRAQLARAQDALMQRDPLFSAKWFAKAAADEMARSSADMKSILAQQANSTVALSRAWDRAAHRAAAQRLAMLPSLQAVYAPTLSAAARPTTTAPTANVASVSEWDTLRNMGSEEITSPLAAPDPPGYEEDLRLYFQALGKAQEPSNATTRPN